MIKPTQDYVLIRPEPPEDKTFSGIIVSQAPVSSGGYAEIIALGEECSEDLKVGMRIFYDRRYAETYVSELSAVEPDILIREVGILAEASK